MRNKYSQNFIVSHNGVNGKMMEHLKKRNGEEAWLWLHFSLAKL